jgi:hypothetical protein
MGTDEHGLGTEFLIRPQDEPELFCKRHVAGLKSCDAGIGIYIAPLSTASLQ